MFDCVLMRTHTVRPYQFNVKFHLSAKLSFTCLLLGEGGPLTVDEEDRLYTNTNRSQDTSSDFAYAQPPSHRGRLNLINYHLPIYIFPYYNHNYGKQKSTPFGVLFYVQNQRYFLIVSVAFSAGREIVITQLTSFTSAATLSRNTSNAARSSRQILRAESI